MFASKRFDWNPSRTHAGRLFCAKQKAPRDET
jgi:hypothetical protein